jgi:CBS domain-containing protein
MNALRVNDGMTHLVVTARPKDDILSTAKRLIANRIRGAPVIENGRLVGVVSEADLVRACTPPAGRGSPFITKSPLMFLLLSEGPRHVLHGSTVADVMATNVVSVPPEASIWKAASLMNRHSVRRLPVVDADGCVIGIITRSDLVRCMARGGEPVVLSA